MRDIKNLLMNKNGLTSMRLAKEFLRIPAGEKIPTVSELSEVFDVARGTIQNSMKLLQNSGAIEIESRGHLGSFLVRKNIRLLLEFSDIKFLVGAMPLPYSRHYEGFATGLIKAAENEYGIPVNLAYMRGSCKRIDMVLNERYDFAIISKMAALQHLKQDSSLAVALDFGPHSFLGHHILLFHQNSDKEIQNGMKVGIDRDSLDHVLLTQKACQGKQVQFVDVDYSRILVLVKAGIIDAGIWNEDEIKDQLLDVRYEIMETENDLDNTAVLVIKRERWELGVLLNQLVDISKVLTIQRQVEAGQLSPSY